MQPGPWVNWALVPIGEIQAQLIEYAGRPQARAGQESIGAGSRPPAMPGRLEPTRFRGCRDGNAAQRPAITACALNLGQWLSSWSIGAVPVHPNVTLQADVRHPRPDGRGLAAGPFPPIGQCPVSPVFRLRGIRLSGQPAGNTDAVLLRRASLAMISCCLDVPRFGQLDDRPEKLAWFIRYDQPQCA